METLIRDIKSLAKEAEVYRQQGLFDQSLEIYQKALKIIENDERLHKNRDLSKAIKGKIKTIEEDRTEVNEASDTPQLFSCRSDCMPGRSVLSILSIFREFFGPPQPLPCGPGFWPSSGWR